MAHYSDRIATAYRLHLRREPVTMTILRDISVVILAVETFFVCIVLVAVLYVAIRGTSATIVKVRIYGPRARGTFRNMAASAESTSQKITAPFVAASSARARVARMASAAFSTFSHRREG
jgi:uncharacterized membrane protein